MNGLQIIKTLALKIRYASIVEWYNFWSIVLQHHQNIVPTVASIDETIRHITEGNRSISRFGDGEMLLTSPSKSIGFQEGSPLLAKRLREVLVSHEEGHLVAIPDVFSGLNRYRRKCRRFQRTHFFIYGKWWDQLLIPGRKYENAFLSRPYMDYTSKEHCARWFRELKTIWEGRDIVFIEGAMSRLGVGNDLFDNAGSIRRILCPPRNAFERYDLVSAPVVDEAGRLVGRLTVNDVLDVIQEGNNEDVLASVGLSDEQDIFGNVWETAKSRWLWLGVNLCTAFFASRVVNAFDGTIERVVALAALMPVVAGMAGNSGNQTLTLLVRSLAMGQVTRSNEQDLIYKEVWISVINGLVWGAIAGLFVWLLYFDSPYGKTLGFVMFLAMVLNFVLGAVVGLAVPLLLKYFGRDPALGGSVLLTFSTDSGGFLIFLGLATLFFPTG